MVVNNLAVLDAPGEYVCTQQGDTATFSWIPPPATPQEGLVPVKCVMMSHCRYTYLPQVMTKLEIIVNVAGAEQVAVEGLSFQHTNYLGLDQGMDWKHAALKVINSQGILTAV